jgi:hypothetical protein
LIEVYAPIIVRVMLGGKVFDREKREKERNTM